MDILALVQWNDMAFQELLTWVKQFYQGQAHRNLLNPLLENQYVQCRQLLWEESTQEATILGLNHKLY